MPKLNAEELLKIFEAASTSFSYLDLLPDNEVFIEGSFSVEDIVEMLKGYDLDV